MNFIQIQFLFWHIWYIEYCKYCIQLTSLGLPLIHPCIISIYFHYFDQFLLPCFFAGNLNIFTITTWTDQHQLSLVVIVMKMIKQPPKVQIHHGGNQRKKKEIIDPPPKRKSPQKNTKGFAIESLW